MMVMIIMMMMIMIINNIHSRCPPHLFRWAPARWKLEVFLSSTLLFSCSFNCWSPTILICLVYRLEFVKKLFMVHRLGFLVIILLLFYYVSKSVVDYTLVTTEDWSLSINLSPLLLTNTKFYLYFGCILSSMRFVIFCRQGLHHRRR